MGRCCAGAWSPARGEGQTITSLTRSSGDFGVTWRADEYLDYGLGGGWAASLKLENQIRTQEEFDDRIGGRLGLQRAVRIGDRASVGLQAAVLAGDALEGPSCAGVGFEGRAMAGTSFAVSGREGFVNVEAGVRERAGGCGRAVAEIAAGIDLSPKWRMLGKAWVEQGDGARSAKTEASLLRTFEGFSLGLGFQAEVSGEFEEQGVVAVFRAGF
jgi:hypothetical protein